MKTVVFRYRNETGRELPFVDLRGEMRDFGFGLELRQAGGGWWEASCELGPGTYAYKFKLAGETWVLDPSNPRTRGADGVRNSLVVVDGAEEPLLHAPAPPWANVEESGLLSLRAGLRRGARGGDEAMRLRWNEGAGWRETAMQHVADEDEHRLFEVRLPASAPSIEYVFRLADGRLVGGAGGAGQAMRLARADVTWAVPDWWKSAVLYTVFVDRFRRGGSGGAWPGALAEPGEARAGGDLDGVTEALPHLLDLGVTALHLTPVSAAPSAHRYDAVDPRAVDPALGGEPALVRLIEAAHGLGLKVLMDLVVTHVHVDHAAFRHVRDHGPLSPWWDWFLATRWPFAEDKLDPGYQHYQKGQWREPLLNLATPEVADDLVATFERWARLGVDGFRIDAAADVPPGLIERIGRAVRALVPEAVVYGEVIPEHLHRYLAHGLDAATDFAVEEMLYDWLWRDRPGAARRAAVGLARRRFARGAAGYRAIGFTATHDQHRFLTLTGSAERSRLALLAVLTRPETPALYYGDEIGLRAASADRQFEGAWSDRQPMLWDRARWDAETHALVRAAIAARRGSRALSRGDAVALPARVVDGRDDEATLAFRRLEGDEVVDVYLHGGPGTVRLELVGGAPPAARPLVALGQVEVDAALGCVTLGPWAGVALAREPAAERVAGFDELVAANRALAALSFREGATQTLSLPAHLYLTVTEGCNLRCAHCLTHAPRLTRERRARRLMPWVLDALREPFAAASYVGFSHGGESLSSPAFFEALAAIGRARSGRPGRTDVHLLTNGMLLGPDTARRLVDGGVTSLAVSIDGATAATNDGLRLGCRLDTVLANVRAALELRARHSWHLRLGLSFVVGQCNVHELPALAELARELGVDWLKLEEMHPATFRARQELLRPGDPRLASGVTAVREILEPTPVVLVDHLTDRPACRCQAAHEHSPEALAFRDADDFANRARFNPCKAAWEQACVDPDGTVHPVDYFAAPLGNLLDASFFDLWNSEPAQRARAAALKEIPPQLRAQCREGIESSEPS